MRDAARIDDIVRGIGAPDHAVTHRISVGEAASFIVAIFPSLADGVADQSPGGSTDAGADEC